ncbi:hypothetical protein GCM10007415_31220 [Parapedobacter pyrenivorans]|uniref:Uncharacterized protein n=1 Tax=Parapedobacter pyrenivorans TaxID=1305674 RepID=A0A917HX50_9SPHI|nr:hypothetical protein GCM10007415_31220 [Parapedobacter pyrenivorans]
MDTKVGVILENPFDAFKNDVPTTSRTIAKPKKIYFIPDNLKGKVIAFSNMMFSGNEDYNSHKYKPQFPAEKYKKIRKTSFS